MHKRASKAVFPPGRAAFLYGKNERVKATSGSTNSISKSSMGWLRADPITMIFALLVAHTARWQHLSIDQR